jgi:hypothetical protein
LIYTLSFSSTSSASALNSVLSPEVEAERYFSD